MRKILLWVSFLIYQFNLGYSQNYIINPSFEDTLSCQQWINLGTTPYTGAHAWYQAISSPDYWCPSVYLNFCGSSAISPNTICGYRIPRTGFGMVGFAMSTNDREIIGAPLQDTLKINNIYYVEFYVSPGGNCKLQTDDIGAYLSDSLDPGPVYQYNILPQVENPQGSIISDTLGWTKISGYYTASGNECFIYIGNFKSDANTTYDTVASATWNFAYYFLDDVSIVDCTAVGIAVQQQVDFNLLQNPVVSSVCFNSPFKIIAARIYNMLGMAVKEYEFVTQNNYKIDVADLPRGVYFLEVETKDKRRGVRKFVKQ